MADYALYDPVTGQILSILTTVWEFDEVVQFYTQPGRAAAPLAEPISDPRRYRVRAGVVEPRAEMALSISAETFAADGSPCVISGLPDPCTVEISGVARVPPTEVTGGQITLTSSQPGSLVVKLTADPTHVHTEITLHAV